MTGVPALALDTETREFDGKNEAQYLARSIKDVSEHYTVEWLDKKTLDWFNLAQCLAMVYGSRVALAFMAKRAARPAVVETRQQAPQRGNMHHDIPVDPGIINGAPRGPSPQELRTVTIDGVGSVEFPPNHPLAPKV